MGTALITGASAGIGLEFAWQLATARHDLVLVARNEKKLNEIAEQIRAAAGVHVEVLPADLSKKSDLKKVADRLAQTETTYGPAPGGSGDDVEPHGPVGLLINNAGFTPNQPFVTGDIDKEIEALNVMVRAVMVLSQAAAKQMVARGRGAICNVGSIAALTAGGTYAAAKSWVRTFTEGLAVELAGTGVTATVVAPGFTRTEFHDRADLDVGDVPEFAWLHPKRVVDEALTDVRAGAVHSIPSKRYKLAAAGLRAAPRAAVRALGRRGV